MLRVAGAVAFLLAISGAVYLLTGDSRVAGSVVARPVGWIVPLMAGLAIAGVGWILLGQHRSGGSCHPQFDRTQCPSCEREVLGQWRMCPYCGSMINGPRISSATDV